MREHDRGDPNDRLCRDALVAGAGELAGGWVPATGALPPRPSCRRRTRNCTRPRLASITARAGGSGFPLAAHMVFSSWIALYRIITLP
jgi:hypothetical protein